MTDSVSLADVADTERFECIGVAAAAESAARIREEFAEWLQSFFDLDLIRSSDLVLAINEALANAAEFAYLTTDRPKTMDLCASYEPVEARLTVTVSDKGVWRVPEPDPANRVRGRGIPLMKALSDRVTIETSTTGTQVCMQWERVASP